MKIETFGSGLVGISVAIGAVLDQVGSSWLALALAVLGGLLALLEQDEPAWRDRGKRFAFSVITGVFFSPLLVSHFGMVHPAAPGCVAFLTAYFGNDMVSQLRPLLMGLVQKKLGGGGK